MSVSDKKPGWFSRLYERAHQTFVSTTNFVATTAADVTSRVYNIAVYTALPFIASSASSALSATCSVGQRLGSAAVEAASIGGRILYNWNGAFDHSNQTQYLPIDSQVKKRYAKVMPSVVKPFYDRFGPQSMLEIAEFTSLAQEQLPGLAGSLLNNRFCAETTRVDLQTLALGTFNFVADKIKTVLPDDDVDARKAFAGEVACDFEYATAFFQKASDHLRDTKKLDWEDPAFIDLYNQELAQSDLALSLGHKKDFCLKLADRLLERVKHELPENIEPHLKSILEAASQGIESLWPNKKRDLLASLLMELHKVLTDPAQIKPWLIHVLDASSKGLEQQYEDFLSRIDHASWWIPFHNFFTSPNNVEDPKTPDYNPAFGTGIMNVLGILRPRMLGTDALKAYSWLAKEKMASGEDFLSVLLRNSTGSSIEGLMAPRTDEWLKSALKIARMNLLTYEGEFITRPGHVPEADWKELTSAQRLEVCQRGSELYQSFKAKQIAQLDSQMAQSSQRIARGVFRAGIIVEQFSPRALDVAQNPYKNPLLRALAGFAAFIRQLPFIHLLANCIYRLSILIRQVIADKTSRSTGHSLDHRLTQFLKTDSMELLAMYLMEQTLDRLQFLAPIKKEPEIIDEATHTKPDTTPMPGSGLKV
jgi:hypothetical protein